ncbi:MAG: FIST C-terminal domain-containing protein [Omnitrophica bacterium]|nr:FIST C-terminal domain-containing protein [Candidatus Omnitrophota bacterium]
MKNEEFAIALSEKKQEEAIKDVSLKIKSMFPKNIGNLIVLFTPHYNPSAILKTINLTLKPQKILGVGAPFLIFEEKVISKGIIACCINKASVELKETFLKTGESQEIETLLRSSLKELKRSEFCLLSFMSPGINPYPYLKGVKFSLGKSFNLIGAGYVKKYSRHNSQIINNAGDEGLINVIIKGLEIQSLKLENFVPLGKSFTISKASADRGLITEIDGQPAVNIYRHYLEEKFDSFLKNNLFSFYPLGIKYNGQMHIINVLECLQDGSLRCLGEIRENTPGYIMFMDSSLLLNELENKLAPIKKNNQGLVFIVNSLTRKKILKKSFTEEISAIKRSLGDKFKIIGLYSDYAFYSSQEYKNISLETVNTIITLWQ